MLYSSVMHLSEARAYVRLSEAAHAWRMCSNTSAVTGTPCDASLCTKADMVNAALGGEETTHSDSEYYRVWLLSVSCLSDAPGYWVSTLFWSLGLLNKTSASVVRSYTHIVLDLYEKKITTKNCGRLIKTLYDSPIVHSIRRLALPSHQLYRI